MKWWLAMASLFLLSCGQTIEPECTPQCDGKQCGPDGCGGECLPGCIYRAECSQDGQCTQCPADYPQMCAPNGCWSAEVPCDTVGSCSLEDGCWGCLDEGQSYCCDGIYICCPPDEPYPCSDGYCYENPGECEGTICEGTPDPTCPRG